MVEVLTYKATKVYTPQTNEWAQRAKDVEAIGKTVSGGLKDLAKMEEKKEIKAEKEAAKVKTAYDKVQEAHTDDNAQRWQIDLQRQTAFIESQYKNDPLNPEKEKQIRAVAKDLQAQWLETMPEDQRQRFIEKTNSKTNEYILTNIKDNVKDQIKEE